MGELVRAQFGLTEDLDLTKQQQPGGIVMLISGPVSINVPPLPEPPSERAELEIEASPMDAGEWQVRQQWQVPTPPTRKGWRRLLGRGRHQQRGRGRTVRAD